jgi:DNA-binding MarR family transcriptional regulator
MVSNVHNELDTEKRRLADEALEGLFALAAMLGQSMAQGLAERGLTDARAELLWRLHQQGPMSQRELSLALRCTPRNVTSLVDALAAAGFVARAPHPADRRVTLITLTESGRAAAAAMHTGYRNLATLLFEDFAPSKLGNFVIALNQVLGRLRVALAVPGGRD